ncbi:hypothetical protein Hanom_Chr08g00691221 [Helianthus anomalus]
MEGVIGLLKLRVKKGINLAVRDTKTSDPYLVATLDSQNRTGRRTGLLTGSMVRPVGPEGIVNIIKINRVESEKICKKPVRPAGFPVQPPSRRFNSDSMHFRHDTVTRTSSTSSSLSGPYLKTLPFSTLYIVAYLCLQRAESRVHM